MSIFYFLDLFGTFIFAVTGALKAVKHNLDILGLLVLSVATGIGGGLIRDASIGKTPAQTLIDENYLIACLLGAIFTLLIYKKIGRIFIYVMILDAFGLGLFALIGANKSFYAGIGPLGVIMMASITATGGGVIRDIFVREIPAVISRDFYATAALIGGIAFLFAQYFSLNDIETSGIVITITTGLRLLAIKFKIELPKLKKFN